MSHKVSKKKDVFLVDGSLSSAYTCSLQQFWLLKLLLLTVEANNLGC